MDSFPHLFNNGMILEVSGAPRECGNNYNGFYEINQCKEKGEPPIVFSRPGVIVALL